MKRASGFTHISKVGVVRLCAETSVLNDIVEGVVHQPTIAARVAIVRRAVYKVLLAQINQLASFLAVESF